MSAPAGDSRAAAPPWYAPVRMRRSWVRLLHLLRATIRASELVLAIIAAGVGAASGLAAVGVSSLAHVLQRLFYGIAADERLSTIPAIAPSALPYLPLGGLVVGLITWAWMRRYPQPVVDPVEANALRGGRMSIRDSLFVAVQSVISNGSGASVGLEAAYAQVGGAIASLTGLALKLRRSDLRTFVGAGAGAGIAAAFGAPLTGAFYAFEIIIGTYTTANIAPVVAAALAGALVSRLLGNDTLIFHTQVADILSVSHYVMFALMGLICAFAGIGVMRLVAWVDFAVSRLPGPKWMRPGLGGVILATLAWYVPETLSAGHGAMHFDFAAELGMTTLLTLLLAKTAASVIALGFGFRGGLFFASLYLGSLLGRLCVVALYAGGVNVGIDPLAGALVGMGAMAVAIIGGPFTMTFLVLETTGDFGLSAATLTASIVASLVVRETFGYSFSTWRLHLRGETIRSAHDVGWLRYLTAGRMMRAGAPAVAAATPIKEFREQFPLGSARRAVVVDEDGRYAGIVGVSAAHAAAEEDGPVGGLATLRHYSLTPEMAIKEIMGAFDASAGDELAVLDSEGRPLGVLTEAHATRRYAEELEMARRDLTGGD
ncbi:MAG: voltage-gated chloride channel [Caulobacteraceae bacterium]|jgi:CIC family chloride channel protein|nr:voltage-gated chloride channel [Caulobacteraceae bacterium]